MGSRPAGGLATGLLAWRRGGSRRESCFSSRVHGLEFGPRGRATCISTLPVGLWAVGGPRCWGSFGPQRPSPPSGPCPGREEGGWLSPSLSEPEGWVASPWPAFGVPFAWLPEVPCALTRCPRQAVCPACVCPQVGGGQALASRRLPLPRAPAHL